MTTGCHVMSKPTGSWCNIDCHYCFYLEKDGLHDQHASRTMTDETLTLYIQQHIDAQPNDEVEFSWQGGEPTLMGLEFFKRAIALQKKFANGKTISNTIQTNGIMLNATWCQFFADNDFLVGVSLDGPKHLHDAYRMTHSGKGTFDSVMKGIDLLKRYQVNFNLLVTVNEANVKHPITMYNFLRSVGSPYLQFIPIVERELEDSALSLYQGQELIIAPQSSSSESVTDWSVEAGSYGQFLSKVFKAWLSEDIGRIYIQQFENSLAAWMTDGQDPNIMCVSSPTCGHSLALEKNGDLYACDHFVSPEYKLGNIHEVSIQEMNESDDFGNQKLLTLTQQCIECEYRFACHGGCPKYRFIDNGEIHKQHYLCHGFYQYYEFITPVMNAMCDILESGISLVDYTKSRTSQSLVDLLN